MESLFLVHHIHIHLPSASRRSLHLSNLNHRRLPTFYIAKQLHRPKCDLHGNPTLVNSDFLPTPASRRTFTAVDIASLWVGLVVGVPTYYLAGSLLHLGMSSIQAISTVSLANLLLLPVLVLSSHPATALGLPFPVLARSTFGVLGSHVPSILRALVACGWFGIHSWIGAEAISLLLPTSPSLAAFTIPFLACSLRDLLCFLAFWSAQLALVLRGIRGIRDLESFSAPILAALTAALLCWAYVRAGGFGPMLSQPSRLTPLQFAALFFPSLTANVSFWATVAVNIPDFARYARNQRAQALGHLGLPFAMTLFTFVGVAVTSATEVIFGEVVSDPIRLLARLGGGLPVRLVAILGISLATITTNIAANVVAPANALVSLNPRVFTFRRGAVATAVAGVLFQPWRVMRTSESFVYTWLVGYSALVGPIAGIMLVDYYLVKGRELDVEELYSASKEGKYYYQGGINLDAMVALLVGILPVVPGFLRKVGILSNTSRAFDLVYANAWFVSFFASGFAYWGLSSMNKTRRR